MHQATGTASQWLRGRVLSCVVLSLVLAVVIGTFGCSKEKPQIAKAVPRGEHTGNDDVKRLTADRDKLDATVWSDEIRAQKHEELFVRLWDALRASTNKYQVLSELRFKTLTLGKPVKRTSLDHGIEAIEYDSTDRTLNPQQWQAWLGQLKQAGFQLIQSEWHHAYFDSREDSPRSVVSMTLHVTNMSKNERYIVKGDLRIEWSVDGNGTDMPVPARVDATRMQVLRRKGKPFFDSAVNIIALHGAHDPLLIAHDMDGDGLSELILPKLKAIYRNKGGFTFEHAQLFDSPPRQPILAALLAELSGDGFDDLLVATNVGLLLYVGDGGDHFAKPPRVIKCAQGKLVNPIVITAGDIDADGDLDVWLGQYRAPYRSGQMPTPYYDANDGYPAFLLRNDGSGQFQDITKSAGLQAKRFRRTYSGSLVDLDDDGDLDLVVVSDFSGVDIYQNDGKGRFADVTQTVVDKRHAFGMSLTFGDYDLDSHLDFFMTGMSSTTARRLHRLGLGRDDFPKHQLMRPAMSYGNRMYLAGDGAFRQAPFNDQVARTGWSWGTTSQDFDNDGDRDVYIANGHLSGRTVKDYCTRFWCHDIYTGDSNPNPTLAALFAQTQSNDSISWNGHEHNVLLWNRDGRGFANISFLAGVAFEFDSRNVIGDDLDGDGRIDLIVSGILPGKRLIVRVLRNNMETQGNWIGLRLGRLPGSGIGTTIRVITPARVYRDVVVAGDSFMSQHAPTVHFGLGQTAQVDAIEVTWPSGRTVRIPKPGINRYHDVLARDRD